MTKILITGSAGFIGFHVTKRLMAEANNPYGDGKACERIVGYTGKK